MNWGRDFGRQDLVFLMVFLLIYSIYYARLFVISKNLKSSFNAFFIKLVMRGFAFGLMALALLGPSFGFTEKEERDLAKDIYLLMDLSKSINATDISPSRLEKVKTEIQVWIENFKSNRIGIIGFTDVAELLSPLTFDQDRLKKVIQNLNTENVGSGGSDLNPALSLALEKLKASDHAKVLVLLTDAEFHETVSDSILAQLVAQKMNISIMVVGSSAGGKIPYLDGFKKDENGQEIISKPDMQAVAAISQKTSSSFFVLNERQNQINLLSEHVKNLKLIEEINPSSVTYNKYIYFLFPALFLLIIDFLSTVRILKI
jgi:Ca-activated chloride channel homolog